MDEMPNVTQSLLLAILELIDKCQTLEELRESVKRIVSHIRKFTTGFTTTSVRTCDGMLLWKSLWKIY